MAETQVPQQDGDTPAQEAPVASDPTEIQRMIQQEAQRIVDQRIPGLQSAYEKQLADVRKQLKSAQSDPDAYLDDSSRELQQQLSQAQRQIELLQAGRQYPEATPVYEAVLSAENAEEALGILQKFVRGDPSDQPAPSETPQGTPPAPAQQPAASPPVDRNRPASTQPDQTVGPEGMTREEAASIIGQFKRWPKFG